MPAPIRPLAVVLALSSVLFGAAACGRGGTAQKAASYIAVATPSPSTPAERQKFARSRLVTNAGLAAGATSRWIAEPSKAGAFKAGDRRRAAALAQAELAGTYAYNRLEAALRNAQGDPALTKALAPLSPRIEALKTLPPRLRKGDEAAARTFADVVRQVRNAVKSAGIPVSSQVPTARQLATG
ncbi:hypothetical protein ABZ468_11670 [Streptomyces sp. NPDC005708]|uniref:hypothetical protein n=1 Tax=unclassified Streptomyces TaxID=2593676 RepID=UPI0033DE6C50